MVARDGHSAQLRGDSEEIGLSRLGLEPTPPIPYKSIACLDVKTA